MKEQLLSLINLQKLDSALRNITFKKKELPERIARMEEELAVYWQRLEESKRKLEELRKLHAEKENTLKKNLDALKKTKERLYEVKTNKEYQAILKEIEIMERKNSETEDEIIVALEEMDQAKGVLTQREKEYEHFKLYFEEQKKRIEEELKNLDGEFLECQRQSADLKKHIPVELLKKYETIKNINNGLAVVPVWKEVCEGCHMNIPPQLYIELQKSKELLSCPNCHRIMYWFDRSKNNV